MIKILVKKLLTHFGHVIGIVTVYDKWQQEIPTETFYWEHLIKTKKSWYIENFKDRMDPNTKLQNIFLKYIDKTQSTNKLLDVGSGPLTSINKKNDSTEIEIYPVDPLANQYFEILKKYNIKPIARTQSCEGEKLTDKFDKNTFDISYSSNAIDHSYNPIKCIEQMIMVTKKKHYIILQIIENEGTNENWYGFHKWNFFIDKKNLWIQGKWSKKINLVDRFKNVTQLVKLRKENQWITAVFKKL